MLAWMTSGTDAGHMATIPFSAWRPHRFSRWQATNSKIRRVGHAQGYSAWPASMRNSVSPICQCKQHGGRHEQGWYRFVFQENSTHTNGTKH